MIEYETDYNTGAGVDKWAYKGCLASNDIPSSNDVPSTEYTSADYDKIKADDDDWAERACIESGPPYPFHRFKLILPSNIRPQSVKQLVIQIKFRWQQGCV